MRFPAESFVLGRENIMNNDILVADEVAKLLRVDKQRVYELVRTNQIPVIRLGERQYRFSRTAIEDFLNGGGRRKGLNHDDDQGRE